MAPLFCRFRYGGKRSSTTPTLKLRSAYDVLNPHPIKTFKDGISLKIDPAEMKIAKSYLNCTEDTALPHHYPWHPRLSQKLGLFRLVQVSGSHELCFSNPSRLAQAIMDAGRD